VRAAAVAHHDAMTDLPTIALRPAVPDDAATVRRLAALDSAPAPRTPALIGLLDGAPAAALSLADGRVVADPFLPTADVVALLRRRAAGHAGPAPMRPRKAVRLRPRWAA
jgi:hypothetical protein